MEYIKATNPIIGTGLKTLSRVSDGQSNLQLNLTNDTHVVPTDEDGLNGNYNYCETTVNLYEGNFLITSNVVYEVAEEGFVVGEWSELTRTYKVTNLIDDTGHVDFKATYKGVVYTCRFTASKAKQGKDSILVDLTNESHLFTSNPDGNIESPISITTEAIAYKGTVEIPVEKITLPSEPIPGLELSTNLNSVTIKALVGTELNIAGWFDISVRAGGKTIKKTFRWIKTKDGKPGEIGPEGPVGPEGPPGSDAYVPEWIKDWTSGHTVINDELILAGKIFAGTGGTSASGVAIGKNTVLNKTSPGLALFSNGTPVVQLFSSAQSVNGHSGVMAQFGTGENAMLVKNNGEVRIPAGLITGKITASQINGDGLYVSGAATISGTLSADKISGGTIKGVSIFSESTYGDYSISMNYGDLYFKHNSSNCGLINFDSNGNGSTEARNRFWIRSLNGYALKIESSTDMSLEANGTIYMNKIHATSAAFDNLDLSGVVAVFG